MIIYSDSFKTTKAYNKAYKETRAKLIKELGLEGKHVNVRPDVFIFEEWVDDSTVDNWLPYTSDKGTLRERLRLNTGDLFRIRTMETDNLYKIK